MTVKKIGGILAAWLAMFALSGLWHTVVMADMYASIMEASAKAEPDLVMVANGYLVLALLMGWVYPKGYAGGSPAVEGAKFGAIVGLLWILPFSLVLSGLYELTLGQVVIDAAWHIVEGAVGGVIVAYGYGTPAASG